MKRILSALFRLNIPDREEPADCELSGSMLFLRGMVAAIFISAPAWLSGFSALMSRAMAFLF